MSGKSSKKTKTYDYYGTFGGLLCFGPLSGIREILVDDKTIWSDEDGLFAVGDFTDIVPDDTKYVGKNGYMRVYWGKQTQTMHNTHLGTTHPPLRGFSYIVFKNFLFGRERTSAPNIEVIGWRLPIVDPSLVPPAANILHDGRANPIAFVAELLTSRIGLELPLSSFDIPSWHAASLAVTTDLEIRERVFCSPFLSSSADIRSVVAPLLELCEHVLGWNTEGKLSLSPMRLGDTSTDGLPVVNANDLVERLRVESGGLAQMPTGVVARYTDRDRKWKEASEKIDSILIRQIRGEPDRLTVDMPFVTKRTQAAAIAGRILVRRGRPASSALLNVRSSRADLLRVGTRVLVDVDPEPGTAEAGDLGLLQAGIVVERREPRDAPVGVRVELDNTIRSIPYQPTWVVSQGPPPFTLPVAHALVIPLAPNYWHLDAAVSVLATRPQGDVIGMHPYFAPEGGTDFATLNDITNFAARVRLVADMQISDTVASAELLDSATGFDDYLAEGTPDSVADAEGNDLVMVLATIDADEGRVMHEDGLPLVEILSVVSRIAIAPPVPPGLPTHQYTVLRSRMGTLRRNTAVDADGLRTRSWPAQTIGWILPGINLEPLIHSTIASMTRGTEVGRVRLVAFSRHTEDVSDPIPERTFILPARYDTFPRINWNSPSVDPFNAPEDGTVNVNITVVDGGGDLLRFALISQADTGAIVTHADQNFSQTGNRQYTATLSLGPAGIYLLQASARDSTGNEAVSIRTVIVPPPGGGGGGTPTFEPPGRTFKGGIFVDIIAAAGDTWIAWIITEPQAVPPGGVWSTVNSTVVTQVHINSTCRLWARSGTSASTFGPTVFAAYERLEVPSNR